MVVDALTGEVYEASAEDYGGLSPELFMDPYGEEPLDISREEFERLLGDFD